MSPVTITADAVTEVVLPISKVEKSVNSVVVPFHTTITSPDLAFEALAHVYLKNAEV